MKTMYSDVEDDDSQSDMPIIDASSLCTIKMEDGSDDNSEDYVDNDDVKINSDNDHQDYSNELIVGDHKRSDKWDRNTSDIIIINDDVINENSEETNNSFTNVQNISTIRKSLENIDNGRSVYCYFNNLKFNSNIAINELSNIQEKGGDHLSNNDDGDNDFYNHYVQNVIECIKNTYGNTNSGIVNDSFSSISRCFSNEEINFYRNFYNNDTNNYKNNEFVCQVCNRVFSQKGNLKTHMFIHTGQRPYRCETCGKCFTQSSNLKTHVNSIHNNSNGGGYGSNDRCSKKKYCCDKCSKGFTHYELFNVHQLICNNSKFLKSSENFEKTELLFSSLEILSDDDKEKLKLLSESESPDKIQNLEKFMMEKFKKRYHCNLCTKSFTQLSNLKYHLLIHSNLQPYPCEFCDKKFVRLKELNRHIRIHTNEKPEQCTMCTKSFSDPSSLKRHLMIHTNELRYKCHLCDKRFNVVQGLNVHLKTHDVSNLYKCDTCDKLFTQKNSLNTHKLIHTGIKPHECLKCDRKFTDKSSLRRHVISIHDKIKSFECVICVKKFSRLINLKNHNARKHPNGIDDNNSSTTSSNDPVVNCSDTNKIFKCTQCDKSFSYSSSLKTHMLSHDIDEDGVPKKMFVCYVCEKKFNDPSNLRRHLKKVHKIFNNNNQSKCISNNRDENSNNNNNNSNSDEND